MQGAASLLNKLAEKLLPLSSWFEGAHVQLYPDVRSGAQFKHTISLASGELHAPPAASQYCLDGHSAASHWFLFEQVPELHEVHNALQLPSLFSVVAAHAPETQS